MIKRKMLLHGSVATAWWYIADEEALSGLADASVEAFAAIYTPNMCGRSH
jgi:hypothetical protein